MDYKVLVNLFVPEIEKSFELYIPINKSVKIVLDIINKFVHDSTNDVYPIKEVVDLYNRRSGVKYELNKIVRDTDIRNGTELVIF